MNKNPIGRDGSIDLGVDPDSSRRQSDRRLETGLRSGDADAGEGLQHHARAESQSERNEGLS